MIVRGFDKKHFRFFKYHKKCPAASTAGHLFGVYFRTMLKKGLFRHCTAQVGKSSTQRVGCRGIAVGLGLNGLTVDRIGHGLIFCSIRHFVNLSDHALGE